MIYIAGIDVPPSSVTITYDALGSQTGLVSTWEKDITLSGQLRPWTWADKPTGGDPIGGQWWPLTRGLSETGPTSVQKTIRWGKAPTWEVIAGQLRNASWLRSEITRLSTATSWVRLFDHALPEALANIIAADMEGDSLEDYTRILHEYQVALDPIVLFPLRLLDLTTAPSYAEISPSEWNEEDGYLPASDHLIICYYQLAGRPAAPFLSGDGILGIPPLRVQNVALSRQMAVVEVWLQRLRLLADEHKAAAVVPLNLSLNPGSGIRYRGLNWVITRSVHRMSADAKVDTTELSLRRVIPIPPSAREELSPLGSGSDPF